MAAPIGPKKVHRYSLEFKIQAERLANHPDIQTQDVAKALGIHPPISRGRQTGVPA
jgi:transposase-like protein